MTQQNENTRQGDDGQHVYVTPQNLRQFKEQLENERAATQEAVTMTLSGSAGTRLSLRLVQEKPAVQDGYGYTGYDNGVFTIGEWDEP